MKLFSLNEMAERTTLEGRKPLQLKYQTVRWTVVFTLGHSLGGAFHGFHRAPSTYHTSEHTVWQVSS